LSSLLSVAPCSRRLRAGARRRCPSKAGATTTATSTSRSWHGSSGPIRTRLRIGAFYIGMAEHREPYDARECAAKTASRIPVTDRGSREKSGSTVLPDGESLKGQEHGGEAGVPANKPDPTLRKTRAIWSRMDCLNPSLQRWKRTSRATACQGADGRIERFHFRRSKLSLPSDGQRDRSRGRTGDLRRAITFDSHGHGITFGSRGPWRRSVRSSPRAGKPATWRRTAGASMSMLGGSRNEISRNSDGRLLWPSRSLWMA
jgi:hypothetical protein